MQQSKRLARIALPSMLAAVLLAGGVSAPAFAVDEAPNNEISTYAKITAKSISPKTVAEGSFPFESLNKEEQESFNTAKVFEGADLKNANIFKSNQYAYYDLHSSSDGKVVRWGPYPADVNALFGYYDGKTATSGYVQTCYNNGTKVDSSTKHDTELFNYTGQESKGTVAYVFTTLSESEFNKVYGVDFSAGGTTVNPGGDNNSGTTVNPSTGGNTGNETKPGTSTGGKNDDNTAKPNGSASGSKNDNTDAKTDPFEGFTANEKIALGKLDYRDAGEDSTTALNIIKNGQTVYTGLKGSKYTVVADRSDSSVNSLLSNHISWYKGSTKVKVDEPFDTETVEYIGKESGKKVTFVFTMLAQNPLETSISDDTGQSTPSDSSQTVKAASSTQNPSTTNKLASTGSGIAVAAGGMAVLSTLGASIVVSRRRLNV